MFAGFSNNSIQDISHELVDAGNNEKQFKTKLDLAWDNNSIFSTVGGYAIFKYSGTTDTAKLAWDNWKPNYSEASQSAPDIISRSGSDSSFVENITSNINNPQLLQQEITEDKIHYYRIYPYKTDMSSGSQSYTYDKENSFNFVQTVCSVVDSDKNKINSISQGETSYLRIQIPDEIIDRSGGDPNWDNSLFLEEPKARVEIWLEYGDYNFSFDLSELHKNPSLLSESPDYLDGLILEIIDDVEGRDLFSDPKYQDDASSFIAAKYLRLILPSAPSGTGNNTF